jgi:biotin transporter BioY
MSAPQRSTVTPVRVALRRLRGYALRNRGYYAVWTATTLGYVAAFVAIPILVGWAVKAVVLGLPAQEVVRRVLWLMLVTGVRTVVRYFSRTLVFNAAREIEYELRNDILSSRT